MTTAAACDGIPSRGEHRLLMTIALLGAPAAGAGAWWAVALARGGEFGAFEAVTWVVALFAAGVGVLVTVARRRSIAVEWLGIYLLAYVAATVGWAFASTWVVLQTVCLADCA